jgi:hypothetical protein
LENEQFIMQLEQLSARVVRKLIANPKGAGEAKNK